MGISVIRQCSMEQNHSIRRGNKSVVSVSKWYGNYSNKSAASTKN
jgi:hypothetical protein